MNFIKSSFIKISSIKISSIIIRACFVDLSSVLLVRFSSVTFFYYSGWSGGLVVGRSGARVLGDLVPWRMKLSLEFRLELSLSIQQFKIKSEKH